MAMPWPHPIAGTTPAQPTTSHDFTIALICALPLEADAMITLFDERWDEQLSSFVSPDDPNTYSAGAIGAHNAVLVYMPSMGKAHAATVAAHCRSSFPNIKLAIVVGICGAVPFVHEGKAEIVLGDVIISEAIVQHDLGRQLPGQFVRKSTILDALGRPDMRIRSLLTMLKLASNRRDLRRKMIAYLDTLRRDPDLEAQYPGVTYDRLFEAAYQHRDNTLSCDDCRCSGKLVTRHRLMDGNVQPIIHFGLVASGDTVMKSGEERDIIAKQENVLCFEMESAGVWDTFPCVVIKSACDYADSHKTKAWQRYAAATAAACTKAFLEYWKPSAAPMFVLDTPAHRISFPGDTRERAGRVSELLKTLNTSPYRDAKDRNPVRVEGTCEWFTNHPQFRHWSESKKSCILWVSADPGCGKSVLAKHLVDNVLPQTKSRTTCYFFFKDDFESQKSLSSALCCIIRQILYQNRQLALDNILEEFEAGGDTLLKSFRGLWDILMNLISLDISASLEIVCIIDALDECEEVDRSQFVKILSQFYQAPRGPCLLKFLVTSRPYLDIRRDFWSLESRLPTIHLSGEDEVEVEKISKEINIVVKSHVSDIASTLQLTEAESEILKSELFQIPNRTYLWVHLILDEVKKIIDITRDNIRSKILKIPKTVDEAYEKILSRSRDIDASRKLLHIILAARRPLSLTEIGLAMAINSSHRSYKDIEVGPETRLHDTIRALCGLFVVVINAKVYLIHQTAKEFLLRRSTSDQDLSAIPRPPLWKASFWPGESNRILAKACLSCLSLEELGNFDGNFSQIDAFSKTCIFSDYSARYWPTHYQLAHFSHELEAQDAELQVHWLCDITSIRFKFWSRLFVSAKHLNGSADLLTTRLMLGSFLGLDIVVEQQLSITDADLYIGSNENNRLPLSWAAQGGFDNIVRLLLAKEMESRLTVSESTNRKLLVNSRDGIGKTPLHEAALEGHVGIVKLFLEISAIDINPEDFYGQTPLSFAAKNGHEAVIRLLLGFPNIEPDRENHSMRTPLSYAAENGHETVVRLLLGASAMKLNYKDYYQRTPLSYAAENGHEAVVRLLLGFPTTEANNKDSSNRTPLSYAVRNGHKIIFELLLRLPDMDLDIIDINGRTPLMYAVEHGYDDICIKLIDTGKVRSHLHYPMGYTLLLCAAMNGYDQITKLLLRETTVDLNETSKYTYMARHTPLSSAIENRHDEVVKVLLGDDRVDVNAGRSNHGHAPIQLAVKNGNAEIVRLLTERDDIEVNGTDSMGRSPLCIASQRGNIDILRSLLRKPATAVNIQDVQGKTPILLAAEAGHEAVVEMLLHAEGIDASIPDGNGQTALSSASSKGHTAVVELLLSKSHGDVNCQDSMGQTSLWMAAANGHASITRLFVERQADSNITPISASQSNSGNPNGQTPLWVAARNGHMEVVRELLTAKDVNVNSVDVLWNQTPLHMAAQNGHDEVVKQLLADERVGVNLKDRHGETPLWGAMWNGHTSVVSTLFQRTDMDRNSVDKLGQTLLLKAVGSSRADIVMQLLADGHVDVNIRDRHGRTPLLKAIESKNDLVVELLLGFPEILLNAEDADGQTALLIALEQNSPDLVELLLRDGRIDPNARDSYGQTPVMRAAMKGSKEIVNLLLADSRVDVAATDNYGDNLVSIAIRRELWELVEHLDL